MIEQGANMDGLLRWGNLFVGKLMEALWWNVEPRYTDMGCTYRGIRRDVWVNIRGYVSDTGTAFLPEIRVDRPWLHGLKPGVVKRLDISGGIEYRINGEGFCDREFSRTKAPGTFRIVALGDSLTFGYAVALEDTWPKRVEEHLGAAGAVPPIEILDLGVSGYNPYVEAGLFTDVGTALGPDLVVLQFCVNDLNDPTLHFDASTIEQLPLLPDEAFPDPAARPPSLLPACTRRQKGIAWPRRRWRVR